MLILANSTQNLLSILVEVLDLIPEPSLNRLLKTFEAAVDTYVPDGPPMSPLAKSYFNCGLLLDLTASLDKETCTTIIIDLAKQFGLHKAMKEVMQTMQYSRMGSYEFRGASR